MTLIVTAALLICIAVLYWLSRTKVKFLERFYSPLGITLCLALVLIACLIQGLVRQEENPFHPDWLSRTGLRSFKDSAFMLCALMLFLINFGLLTVHKIARTPKKFSNLIFLGIFICTLSLLMGGADLQRHKMMLFKGKAQWKVEDHTAPNNIRELPFALQLTDFRIDYHAPELFIVNTRTGLPMPSVKHAPSLRVGSVREKIMMDYKVEVLQYLPHAWMREDSIEGHVCEPSMADGWAPAVKIRAESLSSGSITEKWLTYGSMLQIPLFLGLDSTRALCMSKNRIANYTASVNLYDMGNPDKSKQDSIRPNRPLKAGPYRIYLQSYKENYGFYDPYVTFEWVKDPWEPLTYAGFVLILAGIFLHLIFLPKKKSWQAIASYVLCAALLIITFFNPLGHKHNLMPILNTPWYSPHVFAYIFGYTVLGIAFILAVYSLFKRSKPQDANLYRLTDIFTHIGLGMLLIGMSLGALWAKASWGYFWTWDPKETWALITVLCYAVYTGWRKTQAAFSIQNGKYCLIFQIVGFIALQISWYGINFLKAAQGLSVHVY